MEISSKKQLGMVLSKLIGFEKPKFYLEQYETEPEIAAEISWNAFYRREIKGKLVADLGCGTGILGLSMVLLGAKKVYFIDIDGKAIEIAKKNMEILSLIGFEKLDEKCIFLVNDIEKFNKNVDVVVQNPPFGIQSKSHSDRVFLEKSFDIANIVYSFHKSESKQFIKAIAQDNGFKIDGYWEFNWLLKQTMNYHKNKRQYIKVGCWRLEKNR